MAFKMKGFSPFTAKKNRKVSGKRPSNAPPPPSDFTSVNHHISSNPMRKKGKKTNTLPMADGGTSDPSAMKLKTVPAIPRKGKKSPADRVTALIAKEEAGTITPKEKRELKRLRRFMETGPGSYGNEQWDKE
tara:strand:+ start:2005 stop:2400 length:396 start_codon:yes stop_codon:yes gene_type:complete